MINGVNQGLGTGFLGFNKLSQKNYHLPQLRQEKSILPGINSKYICNMNRMRMIHGLAREMY
jgi:hypothetical protein